MGSKLKELKSRFNGSVMFYITGSLAGIISLAILTMFCSYWITEQADLDAYAINLSGSLRMDSYHLGLLHHERNDQALSALIAAFEQKLNEPIFNKLKQNPDLAPTWLAFVEHWQQQLKPALADRSSHLSAELLSSQVAYADAFVKLVQHEAEQKIVLLRSMQLAALFVTLLFGVFTIHLLRMRVQAPLGLLTQAAFAIGKGDFTQRVKLEGDDELALLAATLNHTCQAIASMYGQLEKRVKEQTLELKRNNQALSFLFNTARSMLEKQEANIDYQPLLNELAELIEVQDIELCLMTAAGEMPYQQLQPAQAGLNPCTGKNCENCDGDAVFVNIAQPQITRYPLVYGDQHYGVLVVRGGTTVSQHSWQHQLVQSVSDQIALSLNLHDQHNQARRIALLQERTVIARELHDSLAQALSYLKIQVTRLDMTQKKQKFDMQQPIIDELRTGLDAAYRQLRELLTTFRLKMVGDGLHAALNKTVEQLAEQSQMQFHLQFDVAQVPLSPMEEIHLLQIAREACQNTVHHSQGQNVWVNISQDDRKHVILTVSDDGVGMASDSSKLNHYGMAIMQERAKHLNGELSIHSGHGQGTVVKLSFTPQGGVNQYH